MRHKGGAHVNRHNAVEGVRTSPAGDGIDDGGLAVSPASKGGANLPRRVYMGARAPSLTADAVPRLSKFEEYRRHVGILATATGPVLAPGHIQGAARDLGGVAFVVEFQ